MNILKVLQL
jgi:hypothetical protein